MTSRRFLTRASIVLLATFAIATSAQAQATRTWVSGVGDDANPCSRTAPCKTFAGAISKTAAGGEISVLDPGGFGAVTITKSITINGDGKQTRDYVYVGDVARANLLALEKEPAGAVNIGTGIETDVNTLFRTLRDLSGSRQEEIHGPPMPGEQRRSVIENGVAFNELGWYPDTLLDEGLALTLAYFRDKVKSSGTW